MSLHRTAYVAAAIASACALLVTGPGSAVQRASTPVTSPADFEIHPAVMELASEQVATAPPGPLAGFSRGAVLTAASTPSRREVFGFALASSLSDSTVGYPTWQFSLLSTVAFFGLHIGNNGGIVSDSGLSVWNSSRLTGLISAAHTHGTKVVVTIILQDFAAGTPSMCAGLANRSTTVSQTVAQVKAKGVDGVNVDYEGLNGTCPNHQSSRSMLTDFMHQLRRALPSGSYLSVDTYASSAADPYGFFDIQGLAPYVDSFFVMAYDLEYSNYSHSPPSCASFCLGPTAPLTGYYYNDTTTVSQYVSVVSGTKVILGVPYYGRKSCVRSATANQNPTSSVVADGYLDASGESSAAHVAKYTTHRDSHDTTGQERWDTWVNTSMNCTRELYWDDSVSLSQKYALVNRANLRGVGIWTLNYGGGAPALWAALSTAFQCPVTATAAGTQTATEWVVSVSAGQCALSSLDFQQQDTTTGGGFVGLRTVPASGTKGSVVVDGYAGHSYRLMVRAHSTAGVVGPWTTVSTKVSATAKYVHPFKGLYTIDAFGGVSPASSPPIVTSSHWSNWQIVRSAHVLPGPAPDAGAVLDGYGALHPFGAATAFTGGPYWNGWDIARDFAFLPNGSGGYVLDGYGGLHPFGVKGKPAPPAISGAAYFRGQDIAKRVVIFSDGTGGYVLDGFGGIHPFGIGRPAPAAVSATGYWPGWDIANDIVLVPGTHSGYVLDGYGALHPFAPAGLALPRSVANTPYWKGWDIARAVWLLPSSTAAKPGGYVLDGYGVLHKFGTATWTPAFTYSQDLPASIQIAGA